VAAIAAKAMRVFFIALAAIAATGASFAQVTLSGRANLGVSTYAATGSTIGSTADFNSRTRVHDASSRITFAVNEDLGGGLTAGVYCETGINIDTATANGQANTANANTSEWCSREGRLSLGNNLAEVRLGRQNVWWTQGKFGDAASNWIGTDVGSNIFNGGTGGAITRGDNMVMLHANSAAGGFAGSQLYYGINKDATGESAGVNTSPTGSYNGMKLNYQINNLILGYDLQNQTNNGIVAAAGAAPAVASFDRIFHRLSVGYLYAPGSVVSLQYWTKERTDKAAGAAYNNGGASLTANAAVNGVSGNGKDSGFHINVQHNLNGTINLFAQYSRANNVTGTAAGDIADSGATAYTLGATYEMSKRTRLYAVYANIQNNANANYNLNGGNWSSARVLS